MEMMRFILKVGNKIAIGFRTSQSMENHRLIAFRLQLSIMTMAVAMQIAPLTRMLVTTVRQAAPSFAVVLKWGIGTATLMGGYDAVSGASTKITSPSSATGKTGEEFFYRITTAPRSAKIFEASPLPEGLMMGTGNFKSYIIGMPTEAGTTNIKLTATKKGYESISKTLVLTIERSGVPPSITGPPNIREIESGGRVELDVVADGDEPFSYQWYHFDKLMPGETDATLHLVNSMAADSGDYSVHVSNNFGSDQKIVAQLNVNGAPAILMLPANTSLMFGEPAELAIRAAGLAPLRYQWFFGGQRIAGATGAGLSVDVVSGSHGGVYHVTVSNSLGAVESADFVVDIDYGVTRFDEALVTMDDSWRYNHARLKIGPEWHKPGYKEAGWLTGGALLYVEGSSLPEPKKTPLFLGKTTYYFRTTFDNRHDPATVALQMKTIIDDGAVFYLNGQEVHRLGMPDGIINDKTMAERTVSNAELEGPFTLPSDALRRGENVLAVEVYQVSSGSSDVVFGLSLDAVVNIPHTPPRITGSPANLILNQGETAVFQVEASGIDTLEYQWLLNGQIVPGATAAKFSITNVQLEQVGTYTVTVSNAFGDVTSTSAILAVNILPSIHSFSANQTAVVGESVIFNVTAFGTEPLSYRWSHNSLFLDSATDSPTFTLENVQLDQAGVYDVTISNEAGTVSSSPISLVVNPYMPDAPAPEIRLVRLEGGQLQLYFETVKGRLYRVDASASLSQKKWSAVSTLAGSGTEVSFLVSVTGVDRNFYRVVLLE